MGRERRFVQFFVRNYCNYVAITRNYGFLLSKMDSLSEFWRSMIKLVFNNMAVNILFLSTFDIDRIILIFEI